MVTVMYIPTRILYSIKALKVCKQGNLSGDLFMHTILQYNLPTRLDMN